MKTGFTEALRRYLADESGISAGIVALSVVFLAGISGLSVDLGYAYAAKVKLQAAANAAALAGATYIGSPTTDPVPVAVNYSAGQGDANGTGNGFLTAMASGYPKLLCLTTFQSSNPCLSNSTLTDYPTGGANAIRVVESGRAPTFFAGIFGISYIPVTATATATSHGGTGKPLDIEMILDTTASMSATDATCGLGSSASKEACAESGIAALLLNMTQSVAKVQLMTFPAFGSQTAGNVDWACPKTTPVITPYWTEASPTAGAGVGVGTGYPGTGTANDEGVGTGIVYTVTPALEQDYQATPLTNPATFNQSRNAHIVVAIGKNASCPTNLGVPGGEGTYYAGAINAAQALLAADGDSPTNFQQVMILLSDGEATSCNNEVVSIPVVNHGAKYSSTPAVTVQIPPSSGTNACTEMGLNNHGGPVQATATAVMSGTGSTQTVASIKVTNGGNDYWYTPGTSTPAQTVTIAAPASVTGTTATATLTLSSIPGVNQCTQAVTAANAAKAAGTEIYVIAYGSSTATSACSTDFSPAISPCTALADIATDTTSADAVAYFYSDAYGGQLCPGATSVTNLATAGALIAEALTKVRLVPNTTP